VCVRVRACVCRWVRSDATINLDTYNKYVGKSQKKERKKETNKQTKEV